MKKLVLSLFFLATTSFVAYSQAKKAAPKHKPSAAAVAASFNTSMERGKVVYNTYCMVCHQADGGGVPNLNAPLIRTSFVLGNKAALITILLKGMQGVDIDGEHYSNTMPSQSFLTNQEIADVLTYVRNSFENKASRVTVAEVSAVRAKN